MVDYSPQHTERQSGAHSMSIDLDDSPLLRCRGMTVRSM